MPTLRIHSSDYVFTARNYNIIHEAAIPKPIITFVALPPRWFHRYCDSDFAVGPQSFQIHEHFTDIHVHMYLYTFPQITTPHRKIISLHVAPARQIC